MESHSRVITSARRRSGTPAADPAVVLALCSAFPLSFLLGGAASFGKSSATSCRRWRSVKALQRQGLPGGRPLVITFDDGYADNLYNAAPLLDRYDVPATLFLATGYIDGAREFWWDALERMLLEPEVLPAELHLTAAGRTWEWSLGEEARHYAYDARRSDREWFVTRRAAPSGRCELYRAVHRALLPLGEGDRKTSRSRTRSYKMQYFGRGLEVLSSFIFLPTFGLRDYGEDLTLSMWLRFRPAVWRT
jgi:Polysaccharide deacetylase